MSTIIVQDHNEYTLYEPSLIHCPLYLMSLSAIIHQETDFFILCFCCMTSFKTFSYIVTMYHHWLRFTFVYGKGCKTSRLNSSHQTCLRFDRFSQHWCYFLDFSNSMTASWVCYHYSRRVIIMDTAKTKHFHWWYIKRIFRNWGLV